MRLHSINLNNTTNKHSNQRDCEQIVPVKFNAKTIKCTKYKYPKRDKNKKPKEEINYNSKNNLEFIKVIIYNLDDIIKRTPLDALPRNKKDIENFLHTVTDNIYYETKIFLTREHNKDAEKWIKDNNICKFSETIINNYINTYYILDSSNKKHYSINQAINEINEFMAEKRTLALINKI